jgi:hypothetical protein
MKTKLQQIIRGVSYIASIAICITSPLAVAQETGWGTTSDLCHVGTTSAPYTLICTYVWRDEEGIHHGERDYLNVQSSTSNGSCHIIKCKSFAGTASYCVTDPNGYQACSYQSSTPMCFNNSPDMFTRIQGETGTQCQNVIIY